MTDFPNCPECAAQDTYQDDEHYICPHCAHEWSAEASPADSSDEARVVLDSNGNPLVTGDAVILIKDLKLKGSSNTIKKGTKVKNIRIVDGDHEVDCKVDGMAVMLKAEFLKKA
ncbi:zinc ribbon domain-containing protein YjdM [Castellaniella sp.]|uniref:zinc ribbon domain-containing protein YjdM n=1 Tax=Castellaniella sp. TaxID=1955812 RepID=UPI002B000467|nr:zinc ribbon domain-containing protein YjdM [Castellaniella sp.]